MAQRQIDAYRDACARHDKPVGTCAIRRDIHVGETAEEAAETAAPVIAGGYRGFPDDALVVGDAEQVAERFRALAEMGYDDVIVRHCVQEPDAVLGSIARLADVRRLL